LPVIYLFPENGKFFEIFQIAETGRFLDFSIPKNYYIKFISKNFNFKIIKKKKKTHTPEPEVINNKNQGPAPKLPTPNPKKTFSKNPFCKESNLSRPQRFRV
jgi:hypothetical protein